MGDLLMKDLQELFVASGMGYDTADDGVVKMPPRPQPIRIVLDVMVNTIEFGGADGDKVIFDVLIPEKLVGVASGAIGYIEYDVELKLPIEAVELAPKTTI
jgi:hypothetical protein